MLLKRLQTLLWVVCLLALMAGSALAHTRKGDKLLKLGEKAESEKQYDQAVDYYDQALATDPKEPAYLMADQRGHSKAAEWHIQQGKLLQAQQRLTDALVEFQRALLADPASQIALQEVRDTTEMVNQQKQAAPGTLILTPAERARRAVEQRVAELQGPPQLRSLDQQISSLKMNNQPPRVLYESLGKLAGINVIFDPEGIDNTPGKNFNLDLNNVTLGEALDYIALETHTFWKPISHNAIFVTKESDTKRREYQDEVVKVFYIQNAATQAEFVEIFNAIRIGSKLNQGLFQVASENAIIARGSPDAIAVVEKLVHDLDRPKPEVIVDVVVMEVSKSLTRTLGAALLGQGGLSLPVNFNPRNSVTIGGGSGSSTSTTTGTGTSTGTSTGTTGTGSTTSTGTTTGTTSTGTTSTQSYFTVDRLKHLSSADFATSLPSALLQALMSDTSSRILQRPQIRCTDGGKASLKIGEKIPYVQGSLNSAVTTAIPYATTTFSSIDVGVNVDLQPHVNGPNDVSMQIKVELSNENGQVSIAGISEPIITQRVNEANIRMKDGEVGLLGGLSDREATNNNSGIPGITNIPVLGYLFGTKATTRSDDEILIALIPHIVRAPDTRSEMQEAILAGSENVTRVERHPDGTPAPAGIDGVTPNAPVVPSNAPAAPYTTAPPQTPVHPPSAANPYTGAPAAPPATPHQ